MLNTKTEESPTRTTRLDLQQSYLNADLDEINPLATSHGLRPKSRQKQFNGEKRRHSSTFSSYYLNKQAKDLASLITIDDRMTQDFILEQD